MKVQSKLNHCLFLNANHEKKPCGHILKYNALFSNNQSSARDEKLLIKRVFCWMFSTQCPQEHLLLQGSVYCSFSKKVSCVQRLLDMDFLIFLSPVFVISEAVLNSWRKIFAQKSVVLPEVFLFRNFLMGSVDRSLRTGGWRIKNSNSKLIGANQLIVCLISTNYLALGFSWFTKLFISKEWFTLEKRCTFLSKAITVHWQNCSMETVTAQNPCTTLSNVE